MHCIYHDQGSSGACLTLILPANTANALLQAANREALAWTRCVDGFQPIEHLLQLLIGEAIGDLGCIAAHPALAGLHYETVHRLLRVMVVVMKKSPVTSRAASPKQWSGRSSGLNQDDPTTTREGSATPRST